MFAAVVFMMVLVMVITSANKKSVNEIAEIFFDGCERDFEKPMFHALQEAWLSEHEKTEKCRAQIKLLQIELFQCFLVEKFPASVFSKLSLLWYLFSTLFMIKLNVSVHYL